MATKKHSTESVARATEKQDAEKQITEACIQIADNLATEAKAILTGDLINELHEKQQMSTPKIIDYCQMLNRPLNRNQPYLDLLAKCARIVPKGSPLREKVQDKFNVMDYRRIKAQCETIVKARHHGRINDDKLEAEVIKLAPEIVTHYMMNDPEKISEKLSEATDKVTGEIKADIRKDDHKIRIGDEWWLMRKSHRLKYLLLVVATVDVLVMAAEEIAKTSGKMLLEKIRNSHGRIIVDDQRAKNINTELQNTRPDEWSIFKDAPGGRCFVLARRNDAVALIRPTEQKEKEFVDALPEWRQTWLDAQEGQQPKLSNSPE